MAEVTTEAEAQPKRPRVRRQKKHHGGHHGGAWKVAYADFITTMMALFLLLWLLNSTDAAQKAQLAQYFRDPGIFKVKRSNQVMDSIDSNDNSSQQSSLPTRTRKKKDGEEDDKSKKEKKITEEDQAKIDTLTAKVNTVLRTGDGRMEGYVNVTRTPTGLRITAVNGPDNHMFFKNTARPTPALNDFLSDIGEGLSLIREAKLTVTGHTDATPVNRSDGYGNFDLSVDRALACKRILRQAGVPETRFVLVEGLGATKPSMEDALDPRNQRVTIDVEWVGAEAD